MTDDLLNIYATPVPPSVTRLMDVLTFPHHVSREVLWDLEFTSLIDAGAGKDSRLAEYVVNERGARYTGIDIGREEVDGRSIPFTELLGDRLRAMGVAAELIEADVRALPPGVRPADVVHARFVLMHLSPDDRRRALEQMLRVARAHVVLLEYSWRTIGSDTHAALIGGFVDRTFDLMAEVHADPYSGEKLEALARDVAGDRRRRARTFHLPEDDHTEQFVVLCQMQADIAHRHGRPDLAREFKAVEDALEATRRSGEPIRMTSAAIHTVVIDV